MAAPTLDGNATGTFSTTSSGTVTLTTTQTNDVIVVVVHCEKNGSRQTVSSVTATGLTFTRKSQYQYDGAGTTKNNVEVWHAPAASAITSKVITVTLDAATDDASIVAFGVNGCFDINAPWDDNAGLPTNATTNAGSTTLKPPATTTSEANDFVIAYLTTATNGVFTSPGSAYTLIATANNSGGTNWSKTSVWYLRTSAVLSGAVPDAQVSTGTDTFGASASAHALTADAPAAAGSFGYPRVIMI